MKRTLSVVASLVGALLLAAGLAVPAQAKTVAPCGEPYAPLRAYTCDGYTDLLAQDSRGTLWIYPVDSDGDVKPRIKSATGWHFNAIVAFATPTRNGVFARDKAGVLWSYTSNNHAGWLHPARVGGNWNQMTSLISAAHEPALLAIDRSGTLWKYPYTYDPMHRSSTFIWLPRQRLGGGFAGYRLVGSQGYGEFLARDTHGTLWPYYFDKESLHRSVVTSGAGWNRYTNIIADGYIVLMTTDTHGRLWLYPNEPGSAHRVIIGHGFNRYTVG